MIALCWPYKLCNPVSIISQAKTNCFRHTHTHTHTHTPRVGTVKSMGNGFPPSRPPTVSVFISFTFFPRSIIRLLSLQYLRDQAYWFVDIYYKFPMTLTLSTSSLCYSYLLFDTTAPKQNIVCVAYRRTTMRTWKGNLFWAGFAIPNHRAAECVCNNQNAFSLIFISTFLPPTPFDKRKRHEFSSTPRPFQPDHFSPIRYRNWIV